jgi:signal transduction histidine kinase
VTGEAQPGTATEDALRAVLDAIADGVVVVDGYGIICFVNPAAEQLFGLDAQELTGRFFGFPLDTDQATEIGVFRHGHPRTAEMRVTDLEWEGRPARLAALRDVTERKRAEQQLRSAVELRDDVIAIVGHDLRSPLATILAAARTLASDQDDATSEEAMLVGRIVNQSWHLSRLVDTLLALSRLEAGSLPVNTERVAVRPVIDEAVEDVVAAHEELSAEISADEGLVVTADATHLRQILVNYLTNAVRYGGPPVKVVARPIGDEVEIVVSDEGDGVPEEFVPHLFERFRRAEDEGRTADGSGLGLMVAARLARASDGDVWYEQNQPSGSCFGVRLPRAGR